MKISNIKQTAVAAFSFTASTMILAGTALAAPTDLTSGINDAQPTGSNGNLFGSGGIFTKIADTLIYMVGAVSVIMLIIGGLRYVISSGNSSAVEGAKNTILYAIIGIIVASLAFAAVKFISGKV